MHRWKTKTVCMFSDGDAKLELIPLGVTLNVSIKIGHDDAAGYNFLYAYLDLELPVGIPLWATGAALYGVSGLNGLNVLPTATNNDWYGWYAGPPEKFSVTDSEKWKPMQGGQAFGAGMVLGALFDAGHVVSAKALFALVLPGPVILVNGKANFLQVAPELSDPNSEGAFDMLAVLDANAGFLQMNIDAGWSARNLIDIAASAEAYFDFSNPANWHFYLGKKKPDSDRIRAYLVALFHADAYLMITMDGIKTGFGVDWGQDWKFGPVKVILQSTVAADGKISWQPAQLKGSLSLAGNFDVAAAGFETGLNASATLSGEYPTPYQVLGDLELTVKLPFPLKDLHETMVLDWKEVVIHRQKIPSDYLALSILSWMRPGNSAAHRRNWTRHPLISIRDLWCLWMGGLRWCSIVPSRMSRAESTSSMWLFIQEGRGSAITFSITRFMK